MFTMQAYNGLKERMRMLNGVGMDQSQQKKVQLIKRLTNRGYDMQVQAINAFVDFLKDARETERLEEEERLRQQKEKDRILRRVCDTNLRLQGMAYRQLYQHMEKEVEKERQLMFRQRGIMRKIVDSNARLMGMGFNKLIEEHKARKANTKEKMKFIIQTLSNKEAQFTLMAYNGLKQRKQMLEGVGLGEDNAQKLKIRLIRKLTDQGFNLQCQAVAALKEWLASERAREEAERLEYERQQKEKDRILRRIMDSNVRMMGVGFRQAYQWMEHDREKEIILMLKQRGIMRRIVDKNARMVSAGYNKLIEEWKVRQNTLKEKLKFVIKAVTDKDAAYILAGYNGLKQRALMLNGVGMGDAEMKKVQLIKRLTNQGYNLQVMAANGIKEFLISERAREEAERLERERQQKEKDRILRRIMDSNIRMMGIGFRQAHQWMEADRDA